ncbi:cytidine/deoxycytidylate deaminase [Streptococcus pneumoniae]|nr:cytidine/deoxycytidylate deaminase [Streptococcus pneumoniae]
MDIWEKMYEEAQKLYNPHEVSDFVYANHVVAAVEAGDGQIFTGFCMEGTCGVFPSLRRTGGPLQYVPIFRTN